MCLPNLAAEQGQIGVWEFANLSFPVADIGRSRLSGAASFPTLFSTASGVRARPGRTGTVKSVLALALIATVLFSRAGPHDVGPGKPAPRLLQPNGRLRARAGRE